MLEANPALLLQTGDVITPGGHEVKRVTIYEFLLGAGDYDLAEKVQGYFSEIKDEHGRPIEDPEKQQMQQYERYRPHIEGMLTQRPYNLLPLIELIKQADNQDIVALLEGKPHKSELGDAIIQFRKDWGPRVLVEPCMHYNYSSLEYAFELLNREWDTLVKGCNYNKIYLVWRQLIGFEMRRLPGIDRCYIAQGLDELVNSNRVCKRSYQFKNSGGFFPITTSDDSSDGLGWDFAVHRYSGQSDGPVGWHLFLEMPGVGIRDYTALRLKKNRELLELVQPPDKQTWCIML